MPLGLAFLGFQQWINYTGFSLQMPSPLGSHSDGACVCHLFTSAIRGSYFPNWVCGVESTVVKNAFSLQIIFQRKQQQQGKKKTKPFIAAKAWKETIAANSTQGRIDVLYPTKGKHRKIGKNNSKEKELRLCSLSPNCNWSAFSELCNKNLLSITCVHLKVWQVPMPW